MEVSRFTSTEAKNDPDRIIDQLLAALVHSDVSPETRENLARVLSETRAKTTPAKFDSRAPQKNNEMVATLMALILGSREFQVK
jgi:signal recognition particle GTPase